MFTLKIAAGSLGWAWQAGGGSPLWTLLCVLEKFGLARGSSAENKFGRELNEPKHAARLYGGEDARNALVAEVKVAVLQELFAVEPGEEGSQLLSLDLPNGSLANAEIRRGELIALELVNETLSGIVNDKTLLGLASASSDVVGPNGQQLTNVRHNEELLEMADLF